MRELLVILSLWALCASAQPGVTLPLVQPCRGYPSASNVACVNRYASVIPYPFVRLTSVGGEYNPNDTFRDQSCANTRSAPVLELIFSTRTDVIPEGPVFVPEINAIIYSPFNQGIFEQQIISLNGSTPTLANYTTNPPVYAVNGGRYFNGSIYWTAGAGTTFPSPTNAPDLVTQTPGIYKLNPLTGEVTTLLNNYYGKQFNSPDDLYIEQSTGDIFFTDTWYGYAINVTAFPVLPTSTWRFRPSTGQASVVESSIAQPNGIGISPDGKTMYISDTTASDVTTVANAPVGSRYSYNALGGNNLYAFDLVSSSAGSYLINKRPIWAAQELFVDGFHVSAEGYLIGASGFGVDVLSPYGELILRIETPISIVNVQFAGPQRKDLWLFGSGGIFRVTWNLTGMANE